MGKQHASITFAVGAKTAGRVVFELYTDLTPKTTEHFLSICEAKNPGGTLFGNQVSKIADGHLKLDMPAFSSKGENYARRHAHAGVLSMSGKTLVITLGECSQLDG